jgi:hypothetical protein
MVRVSHTQTRCASLDTAVSPHGRRSRSRALPIAIYATCPHNAHASIEDDAHLEHLLRARAR